MEGVYLNACNCCQSLGDKAKERNLSQSKRGTSEKIVVGVPRLSKKLLGKDIILLVEGADDRNFFERIVHPLISFNYRSVSILECSQILQPFFKEHDSIRINDLIGSCILDDELLRENNGSYNYFFITDLDDFKSPNKKKDFLSKHIRDIDLSRVLVVERSIECWYAAGVNKSSIYYERLGHGKPDKITKAAFDRLANDMQVNHSNIKSDILSNFDLQRAIEKSPSFKRMLEKVKSLN